MKLIKKIKGVFFIFISILIISLSSKFVDPGAPVKIDLDYLYVTEIGASHTAGLNRTGGTELCALGGADLDTNCPSVTPCTCGTLTTNYYYRIDFQIENGGATADQFWGSYAGLGNLQGTVDTTNDIWILEEGGAPETCTSSTFGSGILTWAEADSGCVLDLAGGADDLGNFSFIIQVGASGTSTSGGQLHGEEDTSGDSLDGYVDLTVAAGDTCSCPSPAADWNVDCADNCEITTACNIDGFNLNIDGAGTFTILADITASRFAVQQGCKVVNAAGDGNRLIINTD